jgi:hypothetical protein
MPCCGMRLHFFAGAIVRISDWPGIAVHLQPRLRRSARQSKGLERSAAAGTRPRMTSRPLRCVRAIGCGPPASHAVRLACLDVHYCFTSPNVTGCCITQFVH